MLSSRQLSVFCIQTAMLLGTGILLEQGVRMMAEDTKDEKVKDILLKMVDQLEVGHHLSDAMVATGAFPEQMVKVIAIGDEAGHLEDTLRGQGEYHQRRYEMNESMKNAVVYPMILTTMMLVVLVFLTTKVLPVFEGVFHSLGMEMSGGTVTLLQLGAWLNQYLWILAVVLGLGMVGVVWLVAFESGQRWLASILADRKISENFSRASFSSALAMLLSSGLDLPYAISLSMETITNKKVKQQAQALLTGLEDPQLTFVQALEQSGLFSSAANGMLNIGTQSGNLDVFMSHVAKSYDEAYQKQMINMVSMIEPVSVAVLAILIGLLLISVMLPLLGALSAIG